MPELVVDLRGLVQEVLLGGIRIIPVELVPFLADGAEVDPVVDLTLRDAPEVLHRMQLGVAHQARIALLHLLLNGVVHHDVAHIGVRLPEVLAVVVGGGVPEGRRPALGPGLRGRFRRRFGLRLGDGGFRTPLPPRRTDEVPQIPREYALASPQPQDSHVSNPPLAVADGRFFRPNRPESPNERGGDRTRGWSPHDKNNPKSGTAPDSPFPRSEERRAGTACKS